MNHSAWSALLQWSRLGVNAGLFLIVARHLTLTEIGAFATAFAPIRLSQVVHKSGIIDAYIISDKAKLTQNAFFTLSAILGLTFTATFALFSLILPDPISPLMAPLSLIPLLHGVSAIHEATLRGTLRIKALALRTLFCQSLSAGLALMALMAGWGAFSLVVFALINALTSSLISVAMVRIHRIALPQRAAIRAALPDILRISTRDLAGSATQPLLQLAVGAMLGLPAAGAFQIAARVLGLLDALAISPIRYIALPRFTALADSSSLPSAVLLSLRQTSLIAALVYLGALATSPEILSIAVGPAHAASAAPLLPAFCLLGLTGALAMPLNQALTAISQSRLPLYRSLATLSLTAVLAAPALTHSTLATAAALPLAAALVLVAYARIALPYLQLETRTSLLTITPALLAGMLMTIALCAAETTLQSLSPLLRLTLKAGLGTGIYVLSLMVLNCLPRYPVTP